MLSLSEKSAPRRNIRLLPNGTCGLNSWRMARGTQTPPNFGPWGFDSPSGTNTQ